MDDLIKALQIFIKYANPEYPFHCEHDELTVDICPVGMSIEDIQELYDLGFFVSNDSDEGVENVNEDDKIIEFEYGDSYCFKSYKYGSC